MPRPGRCGTIAPPAHPTGIGAGTERASAVELPGEITEQINGFPIGRVEHKGVGNRSSNHQQGGECLARRDQGIGIERLEQRSG